MGSVPQFVRAPRRPVGVLGAMAFVLGIAHAWVAAMHWTQHRVTPKAFGFAAVAVLITLLPAYGIAGRKQVRDWNKVGLWFLLLSLVILIALTHVLSFLGVRPG